MASEILTIPEEHLEEFIHILRAGLEALDATVNDELRHGLETWIMGEEEYHELYPMKG